MPRPMINVTLDFTDIETRIAKGERVTVKHLADDLSVSPPVVRRALENHYGNTRIVFKKGRTGGINIKSADSSAKKEESMAT